MLKEFKDFVLRGNVVDLAIAVVIGAAFGKDRRVDGRRHHHADHRRDQRRPRLQQLLPAALRQSDGDEPRRGESRAPPSPGATFCR